MAHLSPHFDIPAGALTRLTAPRKRGRPARAFTRPAIPVEQPADLSDDSEHSSQIVSESSNSTPEPIQLRTTSTGTSSRRNKQAQSSVSDKDACQSFSVQDSTSSLPFARVEFEARECRAALATITLDSHRPETNGSKVRIPVLAEVPHKARIAKRFLSSKRKAVFDDDQYISTDFSIDLIPRFFDSQVCLFCRDLLIFSSQNSAMTI